MIDMEVPVIKALKKDPMVAALVGNRVSRWAVPKKFIDQYPRIRVAELDNSDSDFRDNQAGTSTIDIQVDFWTNGDPAPLQTAIDNAMKAFSFSRTPGVSSFYDEETKVYRKALRYTTKVKI